MIHDPAWGTLKVVGFISGSGNSLWRVHDLQKELEATWEGSPFEVVGCFSSDSEAKGILKAQERDIPVEAIDIRGFYRERKEKFSNMDVRVEYDRLAAAAIEKFQADVIILAGYVWATTSVIVDSYTVINVHPADLAVMKDGRAAYAGANGVGDALAAEEKMLHSSSHIATSKVDQGPLLFISPGVPVDYTAQSTMDERDFMRIHLRQVNAQSREISARTILEIALGNWEIEPDGTLFYKNEIRRLGVRIGSWDHNRPMHERNTRSLISPSSIAVIGASAKGGIGASIITSIQGKAFQGPLAVVNRNGDEVNGVSGYRSITEVPHDVDMAVVTVPSRFVLPVVRDCGEKGVKSLVCISAGFKEVGEEGAQAEQELKDLVDHYNMRMIGPNCMGISNNSPDSHMNTTILHDIPKEGNVAIVTQSGGLAAVLLDYSKHLGIGFSIVASLGNQADVNANDLLPLLAEDESTEVILLYLETIPDYRKFRTLASRISKKKPIVLIKSGRTEAGAQAASSHTGSLAGNDRVTDALIDSCGVIRAESVYSAFFIVSVLSKMPRPAGRRIAVVTNGGGPGIIASDSLSRAGFLVPTVSLTLQEKLKEVLLPEASCTNPIDLVAPAPPAHYAQAVEAVTRSGEYDAVALLCIPPATIHTGDVAQAVTKELEKAKKEKRSLPVLSCFFGPNLGQGAREVLRTAGYPFAEYPEQVGELFERIVVRDSPESATGEHSSLRKRVEAQELFEADSEGYLSSERSWKLLSLYGFSIARPVLVTSSSEVSTLDIQYPAVAKIDHPEVIHKSDAGGVVLNIENGQRAEEVTQNLIDRFPGARGVILQPQVNSSREIILGSVRDESAGQSVMVGLGGVFVELLEDVSFLHVPYSRGSAEKAILSLKSTKLLTGYRGEKGVNMDSLINHMENLNRLLMDFPQIREMDMNPLMYSAEREEFIVADVRIRI